MDFMEFTSDTWLTVFWNHCFNGFFFGKIPLIRKLGWREEVSIKATWGSLSDRNNGNLAKVDIADMQAPMLFPNGTSSLGRLPYVEFGAGVSNILKFIRIDCYWRASYRDNRMLVVDGSADSGIGAPGGIWIPEADLREKVLSRLKTPNFAVKIGAEFKF